MASAEPLQAAPTWFLVLPDTEAAAGVAARARGLAASGAPGNSTLREVPHASGRPWLLGRWAPHTLTTGARGPHRVAVIGEHSVSVREAEQVAASCSAGALDQAAGNWPGSYHLLASFDGLSTVRGTVTGLRSVFHAEAGYGAERVRVASDRPDILADLAGADLDTGRLAVQPMSPGILHPLTARTVWSGVEVLPGDERLVLTRGGQFRTVRCWSPPPDELPLAEGASLLRAALAEAVAVRTAGHDLISADLGGLDSTAVVCTAARADAQLVAYTVGTHDILGDDVDYARRTVQELGTVEHHIVPATSVPLTFDGVDALDDVLDTPSMYAVNRNRRMHIVLQAAERGSRLHLSGVGGDELFSGASAWVHDLLRGSPRAAWRHTRGFTAKYRWSRRQALRQVFDRRSYPAWLRRVAADLTEPQPPATEPLFQWGTPPRMPPWATPDAVDAARAQILEQAETARPLGAGHGIHRELATMRSLARFARHINQMSEPLGMTFSSPYYDDRLVEAALAVRGQERVTPWRYKPLIVEATRGVVPETSRTRSTKAHAALEEENGLRRHRSALLALCEDSRLERLGLIDGPALRAWCNRPLAADMESALLHPTVGCEVWLRSRRPAHGRPSPFPASAR